MLPVAGQCTNNGQMAGNIRDYVWLPLMQGGAEPFWWKGVSVACHLPPGELWHVCGFHSLPPLLLHHVPDYDWAGGVAAREL